MQPSPENSQLIERLQRLLDRLSPHSAWNKVSRGLKAIFNADEAEILHQSSHIQPTKLDEHTLLIRSGEFQTSANPLRLLREKLSALRAGALAILFCEQGSAPFTTREHLLLDEIDLQRQRPHQHSFDAATLKPILDEICEQNGLSFEALIKDGREFIAVMRRHDQPSARSQELRAKSQEPALLVLLHSTPFKVGAGGTECQALDLIESLKLSRALLVYPRNERLVGASMVTNGDLSSREDFNFPLGQPLSFYRHQHESAEDLLLYLLRAFNVGAVLIEHLRMWPLSLPSVFHKAGVPYLCAFHDFLAVCPNLNLLNPKTLQPCEAHAGADASGQEPRAKSQEPASCLRDYFAAMSTPPPCDFAELLPKHQQIFGEILRHAEALVFPSESARTRVLSSLQLDESKTHVIAHGYGHGLPITSVGCPWHKHTRVALLGMLALPIKGSELIVELLAATRNLALEWHLFGFVDAGDFRQRLQATGAKLVLHGLYGRDEIIGKLHDAGVDVALFTSIVEETFSFTLSEVWSAGIPAIVPRLGALGERMQQAGLGWTIEPRSVSAAADLLRELVHSPEQVAAMHEKLRGFKHGSVEENAAAYRSLIEPLLCRKRSAAPGTHVQAPLSEQARLKSLFEAGRSVFVLNAENVFAGAAALHFLSVTREADALRLRVKGDDPALALPAASFGPGRHVLRLDIHYPADDELQVYYGSRRNPGFSEERSTKVQVHRDRSQVYVELDVVGLAGRLRIDPAPLRQEIRVYQMELRAT
ncbi:MAG TPA: hypothetical protein VGP72_00170 [Planctomycetota bacterium]